MIKPHTYISTCSLSGFKLAAFIVGSALLQTALHAATLTDQTFTSPLLNSSDTFTGTTTVSTNVIARTGGIGVTQAGVTTSVEGSLFMTINTPDNASLYPIALYSSADGGIIDVKTLSGSDRVVIDVYGQAGTAIRAINKGVVNIDVSSYTGEGGGALLRILYDTSASNSTEAAALEATSNGIINATGNFDLYSVQDRGYGLWTAGAEAKINVAGNLNIITEGAGGYGIRADGGLVEILGDIDIETRSAGYTSGTLASYYSWGMQAQTGGKIVVGGKTTISTVGANAYGVHITNNDANSSIHLKGDTEIKTTGSAASGIAFAPNRSLMGSSAGSVIVDGALTVATTGASAHGVRMSASAASSVTLNNAATFNLSGNTAYGLYTSTANSTINVANGDLVIKSTGTGAAHGIFASNGKINLSGVKEISLAGTGDIIRAASSGVVTGVAGKYLMEGRIYATGNNSAINLAMADASYYKGQAVIASNGKINFVFSAGSTWENLVAASSLTSVSFEDSTLIMTLASESTFSKLALVDFSADEDSIIKIVLADGFSPEADLSFQIVSASGTITSSAIFDFSDAALAEGFFWDTSDFLASGIISVREIPEASTYAAIFGVLALGFAAYKRRKK